MSNPEEARASILPTVVNAAAGLSFLGLTAHFMANHAVWIGDAILLAGLIVFVGLVAIWIFEFFLDMAGDRGEPTKGAKTSGETRGSDSGS